MMNFKLKQLLIGGVILPFQLFSQKNLDVSFKNKFVLDKTSYFSSVELTYKVKPSGELFYVKRSKKKISIYRKKSYSDSSELFHAIKLNNDDKQFFTSFDVDVNTGCIYYLFNDKVQKFNTLRNNESCESITSEQEEYVSSIDLHSVYYDLYLQEKTIVLTACYNHYVENGEEAKGLYFVIDRDSLNKIYSGEFDHDAIGFSHLPYYFSDVYANKIVFTNALKHEMVIIDLNDLKKSKTIGTSNLLNKKIKKIPFNTTISSNVNAKEVVYNISKFSKQVDRIEGVSFVNDSTIMLVEKKKSKSMRGKRVLYFYTINKESKKWGLVAKRRFRNRSISRKKGILQFYYPSGFEIIDGKIYIVEFDLPKNMTTKNDIENYMRTNQEVNFAIYEFRLSF